MWRRQNLLHIFIVSGESQSDINESPGVTRDIKESFKKSSLFNRSATSVPIAHLVLRGAQI
jgi:hypothetical protein